jgi:plastocyanin
MRPRFLLALALPLIAASPAMAADQTVTVPDYRFAPSAVSIDVGDRVTWRFAGPSLHTSTSRPGQADRWNSGSEGPGGTFARTFTKPGRFNYICIPHPSMTGVVTVGTDQVGKTLTGFQSRRAGTTVTVSFRLNEPASVTYKLTGASRETVRKGRLRAGRHSFKVRGLEEGRYAGTLTATDDFDNRARSKKSFVVR